MNIAILLAFTGVVCGQAVARQLPLPDQTEQPEHAEQPSDRWEKSKQALEKFRNRPVLSPAEAEANFVLAVENAAKAADRAIEKDEAALIAWRCVAGEGVPIPEWTAELLGPENELPEKDETPYIGAVLETSSAWRVCFKDVAIPCLQSESTPDDEQQPAARSDTEMLMNAARQGAEANAAKAAPVKAAAAGTDVAKRDMVVLLHAGSGRLLKISLGRDGAPESFRARPRLEAVELMSHGGGETWLDLPEKVTLDFLSAAKLVRPLGAGVCGAERVEAVLVTRRAFPAEVQTVWSIELIGIPPHGIGHGPREARTYLRHIIDAEKRKWLKASSSPGVLRKDAGQGKP
jgi:hypothetical protein